MATASSLGALRSTVFIDFDLGCDNQSCIAIAKNPVFHARTKHIEVHYHYVREQILSGNLHLSYCPTKDNAADIFTKPVAQTLLHDHMITLGVCSSPGSERGC